MMFICVAYFHIVRLDILFHILLQTKIVTLFGVTKKTMEKQEKTMSKQMKTMVKQTKVLGGY